MIQPVGLVPVVTDEHCSLLESYLYRVLDVSSHFHSWGVCLVGTGREELGFNIRCQNLRVLLKGGSDSWGGSGGGSSNGSTLATYLGTKSGRSRRNSAILLCPFSIAHNSGVKPYLSGVLGLTSFHPSSALTTPSCPFSAANENGVWWYRMLGWYNPWPIGQGTRDAFRNEWPAYGVWVEKGFPGCRGRAGS